MPAKAASGKKDSGKGKDAKRDHKTPSKSETEIVTEGTLEVVLL